MQAKLFCPKRQTISAFLHLNLIKLLRKAKLGNTWILCCYLKQNPQSK